MEVACSPPESLGSQLMMIFGGLVVKNYAAICSDRVIVRLEVEGGILVVVSQGRSRVVRNNALIRI